MHLFRFLGVTHRTHLQYELVQQSQASYYEDYKKKYEYSTMRGDWSPGNDTQEKDKRINLECPRCGNNAPWPELRLKRGLTLTLMPLRW